MSRRAFIASLCAAALVAAALLSSGPSTATEVPDDLAFCVRMRAVAQSPAEIAWADTCLALAGRTAVPSPTAQPSTPGPTTATPTPTVAPTTAPTTASPSSTPPPTTAPTGFPTAATTGVPAGWVPRETRTSGMTVSSGVVQDIRIVGGNLTLTGPVTVRRVELVGGRLILSGAGCRGGAVIEDVSILRGSTTRSSDPEAIGPGGYTARRVELSGVPEGFRVGGRSSGCGPVVIEDSYAHIVAPDQCGDWHGDGLQGYDGPALTVRNTAIHFQERGGCGGTSPFFVPSNQGNTSAVVDGLLVSGGGYGFRLGVTGSVRGLAVVDGSWGYGPVDVRCSALTAWDARVVTSAGATVRALACTGSGT